MKTYACAITVALALLMPLSAVATPDFMKQNIGSLDCGINEIAKFNGVAWECSSDLDALSQAIEEVGDLGCSATQQDNSVLIKCGDGTAGVIAGAGTVVLYPEGQIGQVPPIDYNTGPIVAIDGSGVVLGKVLGFEGSGPDRLVIELDANRSADLINSHSTQEVIFVPVGRAEVYFLSDDCTGNAFGTSDDVVWELDGRFFVAASTSPEEILFNSHFQTGYWIILDGEPRYVEATECYPGGLMAAAFPLVEYFLAAEIANAVYPVRIEQLP